jgi:hypothetical protein
MVVFDCASLLPHPPGEKKRLKRERMQAKRAARAADRGFDLAWVNRQLEEFVARQVHLQVRRPFPTSASRLCGHRATHRLKACSAPLTPCTFSIPCMW